MARVRTLPPRSPRAPTRAVVERDRRRRERLLLELAPRLAAATELPALLESAPLWAPVCGAVALALYLAPEPGDGVPGDEWRRVYDSGLPHGDLAALDAVLAFPTPDPAPLACAAGDSDADRISPALSRLDSPALLLPLRAPGGSSPIGLLLLGGVVDVGRPVTRGGRAARESVASQLAAALARVRALDRAKRDAREASVLAEAGRLFNASPETGTTLATVVELVGHALEAACTVFLVEPGRTELRPAALYHPDPAERERRRGAWTASPPRRDEGVIGASAASAPATLARDAWAGARATAREVEALGRAGWLCAPLRDRDEILGVLTLDSDAPARRFDEGDLALAEALAARAGEALARARLHEERRRGELLQGTIAALSREVGGTLNPGDVARRLSAVLGRNFAYPSVGVFLIDRDRREVVLRGVAGVAVAPAGLDDARVRLPFGSGIVGWVAEQDEAIVIPDSRLPDVTPDPPYDSPEFLHGVEGVAAVGAPGRAAGAPVRSQLTVPIPGSDGQGPLGVIDLKSAEANAFDTMDLYIVRGVARQAAVALENAALHARLAESAATFRDLVEHAPDPFFVLSLGGRFLVVNEATCDLTGRAAGELQALNLVDVLIPEDRENVLATLAAVLDQGRAVGEWTVRRPDSRRRTIEVRMRALAEGGRPVGVQVVARDVTERREQRRALEQRVAELSALHEVGLALSGPLAPEELQRALLEALQRAIPCDSATLFTLDDHGVVRLGATLRPLGDLLAFPRPHGAVAWTLEHGRSLLLNDAPDDPRFVPAPGLSSPRHLLLVPLRVAAQAHGCIALRRMQGESFLPEELRLVESVAAGAAATLHNARLHAETAQAAADLRAVLESIEQGVVMADRAGRISLANGRLGELLDLDVGAIVGQSQLEVAAEFVAPQTRDPGAFVQRLEWLYAHPEEAVTDEVTRVRPAQASLERYSGPVRGADGGKTIGRIEVYTDVTEERRLERAKDEFLATASHELKTPITTLRGYLELLARQLARPAGPDPARLARYVGTAQAELGRLGRLVEDLLEVARIEAGRLTLRLEPGDLRTIVSETVARFVGRPGLRERGHQLVCHAAEPLPGAFDALRLSQVLNNLLENALKYSPAGGEVTVDARRAGDEALIGVRDMGIGVPGAERDRLFLPFYRAANASDGSPEGLGLGLYISRGIVERHGGRLWVEPAPGGGSLFHIALPLTNAE